MRFFVLGFIPQTAPPGPIRDVLGPFWFFFASWLSYKHFKMTPWGPMYWGNETPQCPMYRGVAKLDPLKIQKSPKYRWVETPRCPRYRRVETPRCPKHQRVKTLELLCESKLPSVLCTGELWLPGVLCTGESFFCFLNLKAHAVAFKATFIQKAV